MIFQDYGTSITRTTLARPGVDRQQALKCQAAQQRARDTQGTLVGIGAAAYAATVCQPPQWPINPTLGAWPLNPTMGAFPLNPIMRGYGAFPLNPLMHGYGAFPINPMMHGFGDYGQAAYDPTAVGYDPGTGIPYAPPEVSGDTVTASTNVVDPSTGSTIPWDSILKSAASLGTSAASVVTSMIASGKAAVLQPGQPGYKPPVTTGIGTGTMVAIGAVGLVAAVVLLKRRRGGAVAGFARYHHKRKSRR